MSTDKPKRTRKAGAPRFPAPRRLALVHSAPERPRPGADPELRRLLDKLRRPPVRRARLNFDPDEPEAA